MENHPYAPAKIEPHWQAEWREKEAFKIPNDIETLKTKPKFYVLGHVPLYVWCRTPHGACKKPTYRPMSLQTSGACKAIHVMHPMGWGCLRTPDRALRST